MKVLILALLVAFAACEGLKLTPPMLPEQFSAKFEEASVLIVTGITEGFWYYDSKNKMESIYRFNGRYDRYCGNIFKNQETPCRHVIVNGTFLFTQERDILISQREKSAATAAIALRDAECSGEIS